MDKFSLSSLKPTVVNLKINNIAGGEDFQTPAMPLTFTEYQNVLFSVPAPHPDDFKVRKLVNGKHEEVFDNTDPEYVKASNEYAFEIKLRRVALSLAGAGAEELQDKSLEEQADIVRGLRAGVVNAIAKWLDNEANRSFASRFQAPDDLPEAGE